MAICLPFLRTDAWPLRIIKNESSISPSVTIAVSLETLINMRGVKNLLDLGLGKIVEKLDVVGIVNNIFNLVLPYSLFFHPAQATQGHMPDPCTSVPFSRIFREGLSGDFIHNLGDFWAALIHRKRIFIDDFIHDREIIIAGECLLACEQLIKDASQGKDIALVGNRLLLHLFGDI